MLFKVMDYVQYMACSPKYITTTKYKEVFPSGLQTNGHFERFYNDCTCLNVSVLLHFVDHKLLVVVAVLSMHHT